MSWWPTLARPFLCTWRERIWPNWAFPTIQLFWPPWNCRPLPDVKVARVVRRRSGPGIRAVRVSPDLPAGQSRKTAARPAERNARKSDGPTARRVGSGNAASNLPPGITVHFGTRPALAPLHRLSFGRSLSHYPPEKIGKTFGGGGSVEPARINRV